MYALSALATNIHRFLQRLQPASVARYYHPGNANDDQDYSRDYASQGARGMNAEHIGLIQHTNDKRDNADDNNADGSDNTLE